VGTKTQQLAEATGSGGRVFAVDAKGSRISTLRRLVSRRADLKHIIAKRGEWMSELGSDWPQRYDRILIDAPCSNSGVLARRAEARYADLSQAEEALPALQLAILRDTWPHLSADGVLAYATCSVFPEENGELVRRFLSAEPGAELVMERAVLPSFRTEAGTRYHDGGYLSLLRRRPEAPAVSP
jgi:16S rRNA (cytosine967-C5)-methyltransferase